MTLLSLNFHLLVHEDLIKKPQRPYKCTSHSLLADGEGNKSIQTNHVNLRRQMGAGGGGMEDNYKGNEAPNYRTYVEGAHRPRWDYKFKIVVVSKVI